MDKVVFTPIVDFYQMTTQVATNFPGFISSCWGGNHLVAKLILTPCKIRNQRYSPQKLMSFAVFLSFYLSHVLTTCKMKDVFVPFVNGMWDRTVCEAVQKGDIRYQVDGCSISNWGHDIFQSFTRFQHSWTVIGIWSIVCHKPSFGLWNINEAKGITGKWKFLPTVRV